MVEEHGVANVFVDTQHFGPPACEVIAHSFGRGPCRFWISHLRTPADISRIIAGRLRLAESTLLWPRDAPCLPGFPLHVAVLPPATPAHQCFALVDARRVFPTGGTDFWLIHLPSQLNAATLVSLALAGRQVCITPTCATVDGIRRTGDVTLSSRIVTVTLHGSGCSGRNCIFENTDALRTLPGFQQEVMRFFGREVRSLLLTSTTTTTGSRPSYFPRAASRGVFCSPGNVSTAPLHFFASCGNCRPVEVIIEGCTPIETVLATVCDRLCSRSRIPPRASWLLSDRLHWLGNGDPALFLASGWGSFEPREVMVWIDAFPLWATPYLTVVPNFVDKGLLLSRVHLPGVSELCIAIDGIMWQGDRRFLHNGVVIQFRPLPLQLATLPVYSVMDRIAGISAAQIGIEGPDHSRWILPSEAWHAAFADHFWQWASPFRDSFEPTCHFNSIYLVVQCGPCLCLSLGTPLAPSLGCVQQAYDELLSQQHGPRLVEDSKFVWDDRCIYLARRVDYPARLWFVLNGPVFDVIQMMHGQLLSDLPAPAGYSWFPQEVRGNVGIIICRPSGSACPSVDCNRLDALEAIPPSVVGAELTAYDVFGSASEGSSSSSSSSSSTPSTDLDHLDPTVSSSTGLNLLQKHAVLSSTQQKPVTRCVPTPCRARSHTIPKQTICLVDCIPAPPAAFTFGIEPSMLDHCCAGHAFAPGSWGLRPTVQHDFQFLAQWNSCPPATDGQLFDEIVLYTDGSFDPCTDVAAWAVVAAGRSGATWYRVGIAAAAINPRLGKANAFVAELEALLHAEAFISQLTADQFHVYVDCYSALQLAAGAARTSDADQVARACTGLQILHGARGKHTARHKVAAHQGHFLNEVADAVAKAVVFRSETAYGLGTQTPFWQAIDEGIFEWLWLAFRPQPEALPFLTPQGTWSLPACDVRPSTQATCSGLSRPSHFPTDVHRLDFRVLQYNCLSLKGDAAREMIHQSLVAQGVQLAAFQETRRRECGISRFQDFWVLSSPCNDAGQEGCQIWLHAKAPLAVGGSEACCWDRTSFMTVCAEPRLLVMLASAGPLRYVIVAAHAFTAATPERTLQAFWQRLASMLRRVPRTCMPIVCIDANARFSQERSCPSPLEAHPLCRNAEMLTELCHDFSLEPSSLFSLTGQKLRSWCSPNGKDALLDFVLVSSEWKDCFDTLDTLDLDDLHKGYDHFPVAIQCRPAHAVTAPRSLPRINWAALDSPEGRQVAINAWVSIPTIPWEVDATSHVDQIHTHLRMYLAQNLPPVKPRPRNPAISGSTLDLIRIRRHVRRCERSTRSRFSKEVLRVCFGLWPRKDRQLPHPAPACGRLCRTWFRRILALNKIIAAALSKDKATFYREMLQQAKNDGPSTFAHRIRAITRQGRKFRAPQSLPVLRLPEGPVYGRESFQDVLGEHFASAERATPIDPSELLQNFEWRGCPDNPLAAGDVPSIPALASGFAQLKTRRAPGLSGLAPELFRLCPAISALAFWPVVAKSFARGCIPAHWGGGLLAVVPKPNKAADAVEGWRSILLLEQDGKAFQKAVRPGLVKVAMSARSVLQFGGLPRMSLSLPSLVARSHLVHLRIHGRSGGLIFVDVKTAYYAVVRDIIAATPAQRSDPSFVASKSEQLFRDPQLRQAFAARLSADNPLLDFGISPATLRYVQCQLGTTWFTTRRDTGQIFAAKTGTAPGSPVADVLFSLIFREFLLGIGHFLKTEGIAARLDSPLTLQRNDPEAAALPAWADDSCIPFEVADANMVEPAIAAISTAVGRHLAPLCLEPNFNAGKTEAIAVFQGRGSRSARRNLLCGNTPIINFENPDGTANAIRLVPQYPHLGTLLRGDLSEIQNLRSRAKAMWSSFRPTRNKLLSCPDLSPREKTHLLRERVLPRFHHQAGIWRLATRPEQLAALEPVRKLYRSAFRPITGLSSGGYCNEDIAAILGLPTAEEFLDVERCRAVQEFARVGCDSAWTTLAEDRIWLGSCLQSLDKVLHCSGELTTDGLSYLNDSLRSFLLEHSTHVKAAGKAFLRKCVQLRQPRGEALLASPIPTREHTVVVSDSGEDCTLEELVTRFHCRSCRASFDTQQKLAVHVSRKHRQYSEHVRVATGTVCEICRKQYWSLHRLQQHFKKSPRCLTAYDDADRHFGDESGDFAPGAEEGSWRPVADFYGPTPWWATLMPNTG